MDAKVGIEQWRQHYNEVRPHSSLSSLTPAEVQAGATRRAGAECRAGHGSLVADLINACRKVAGSARRLPFIPDKLK